LDIYIVI